MTTARARPTCPGLPILKGLLPIKASQVLAEVIAGLTLAARAIPEIMGYAKIAGTPVVTGLYIMLIKATRRACARRCEAGRSTAVVRDA